jgi:hypothetical protein
MWGKAALAAAGRLDRKEDAVFCNAQIELARFYMSHVATQAGGLAETIAHGAYRWDAPLQ